MCEKSCLRSCNGRGIGRHWLFIVPTAFCFFLWGLGTQGVVASWSTEGLIPLCDIPAEEHLFECNGYSEEEISYNEVSVTVCVPPSDSLIYGKICSAVVQKWICDTNYFFSSHKYYSEQHVAYPFSDCVEAYDVYPEDGYKCSWNTIHTHTENSTRVESVLLVKDQDGYLLSNGKGFYHTAMGNPAKIGLDLLKVYSSNHSNGCGWNCKTVLLNKIVRENQIYFVDSSEGLFFSVDKIDNIVTCNNTDYLGTKQGVFLKEGNRTKRDLRTAEIDFLRHKSFLLESEHVETAKIQICQLKSKIRSILPTALLSLLFQGSVIGFSYNNSIFIGRCMEIPFSSIIDKNNSLEYRGKMYNYSPDYLAFVEDFPSEVNGDCLLYDGRTYRPKVGLTRSPIPSLNHLSLTPPKLFIQGLKQIPYSSFRSDEESSSFLKRFQDFVLRTIFSVVVILIVIYIVCKLAYSLIVFLIKCPFTFLRNLPTPESDHEVEGKGKDQCRLEMISYPNHPTRL